VVEARIKTLIDSLAFILPSEVDITFAEKHPNDYDLEAYKRLDGNAEKRYEQKFLDLPDDVVKLHRMSYHNLAMTCAQHFNMLKIARNYAYHMYVDIDENMLKLYYSSSYGYYKRFDELVEYCKQLTKSLNDMLWDSLQYVIYEAKEAEAEKIKWKVHAFYREPKYLDVVVCEDHIEIYAPKQLMGRVIGKQGSNVKKLEEWLGKKVKVYESESLTSAYAEKHPEIPKDPETLKLISEAIRILSELEKRGVTVQQLLSFKETLEGKDEYE
jgi:predicted RNA-binding protein YlqC (UPF0109 family)